MANISVNEISLRCHPQSDPGGITAVDARLACVPDGTLDIVYRVSGQVDLVEIPTPENPDRTDGLWKNTCFELFIGCLNETFYLEYNFAPSGRWAAYEFGGYRAGASDAAASDPVIQTECHESLFVLSASVVLPDGWRTSDLLAGISAVIVSKSGDISYWAVAHPPGKPDFHHRHCFALQLEAPSAA